MDSVCESRHSDPGNRHGLVAGQSLLQCGIPVSYTHLKTIEDNGRTLTLQNISWQTDNTANTDGYAMGDRFTAVATYTGSATSNYVTGYTVTADYSGTVSRIALNKTRYVAIFEGTAIEPVSYTHLTK